MSKLPPDIEQRLDFLADHNPVVHDGLTLVRKKLCSRELALATMVIELCRQNDALTRQITEALMASTTHPLRAKFQMKGPT